VNFARPNFCDSSVIKVPFESDVSGLLNAVISMKFRSTASKKAGVLKLLFFILFYLASAIKFAKSYVNK
jgi:hypothetical protein